MHDTLRASGPSRFRPEQPTSEAWHDLSRYVAASRAAADKAASPPAGAMPDEHNS